MSLLNEIKELKKLFLEVSQTEKDIIEAVIEEGVDDPGILKCVFMAGGPGSGKSYKAAELFGVGKGMSTSFSAGGLKIVNSDNAFEVALERNGIDAGEIAKMKKENPELWDKILEITSFLPKDAKPKTDKEKAKSKEAADKLNAEMTTFLNSDQTKNIINSSVSKEEAQTKINKFIQS
jgi:hypothetical protein